MSSGSPAQRYSYYLGRYVETRLFNVGDRVRVDSPGVLRTHGKEGVVVASNPDSADYEYEVAVDGEADTLHLYGGDLLPSDELLPSAAERPAQSGDGPSL